MPSYSTPQKTIQEKREDSDQVVLTSDELSRCKDYIVQMKKRRFCAFLSNPRIANTSMMLNLTKDMQSIMSLLSPFDYYISPFTTIDIFKSTIRRHTPEIVCYYGHAEGEFIYLENDKGFPQPVNYTAIIDALNLSRERLKCVALFACLTQTLALQISQAFPDVYILFWSTKTLDRGAQVFSQGFLNYVAKFETMSRFEYAYWHGYTEFKTHFKVGDPLLKYADWMNEVREAKTHGRIPDYSKKPDDGIPGLMKNSNYITYEEINTMRLEREAKMLEQQKRRKGEEKESQEEEGEKEDTENIPPIPTRQVRKSLEY